MRVPVSNRYSQKIHLGYVVAKHFLDDLGYTCVANILDDLGYTYVQQEDIAFPEPSHTDQLLSPVDTMPI